VNTTGWLESGDHCEWAGVTCEAGMLQAQALGTVVANVFGNNDCNELGNQAESGACEWFENISNHPFSTNADTYDNLKVSFWT
jgi:hypothetical protein